MSGGARNFHLSGLDRVIPGSGDRSPQWCPGAKPR